MTRKLIAASAIACCLAGGAYALVSQEYVDPTGAKSWVATVIGYVDGSGRAQSISAANPLPVGVTSGSLTPVLLDIASVTTGGTAVNALSTGHAAKGGYIGTSNTAGICIDQITTAGTVTGTPSSTWCVAQNQPFNLVPNGHAVSVNSTASSVSLAGEGLN